MNDSILFTPSAVLGLLTQIEELKDYEISVIESDSSITISIGDSAYTIDSSSINEVEVDSEVVDEVTDVNDEGYEDLEDEVVLDEVEGGILKEIAKTLMIGGMIRLTDKLLDKNRK